MNTSQPKPETSMGSVRTEDEDAEIAMLTTDRYDHEQQTRGGIQPACMETNDSTPKQNTEAINTTAPVDASPQDTYYVDVAKRVEQSVSDRVKGAPTAYSGGDKTTLPYKWADP
jgi:hypothetical protein